jgi:hopanoid-associated phosphorylase
MPAGAITGLAAEARIARRAGLIAVAGGGDLAATRAKIERLFAEGVSGLVSFGICGGLDPSLASGDLVLASEVRSAEGRHPVDRAWHERVAAALARAQIAFRPGVILGLSALLATAASKAAMGRAEGALAVDMESHVVAVAARAAGRPFLVLRAVADAAGRDLPPAALAGLDSEGRPALASVLRSLLAEPRQLGALIAVARDSRKALAAVRRAAPFLG